MSDCKHDDYQITVNGRCQRCGEIVAASSFAAPACCAAPCVTRIGDSNGKAFVVYLRDGTKITVGRDKTTKGPAWLKVEKQLQIKAQHNSDYATGVAYPDRK